MVSFYQLLLCIIVTFFSSQALSFGVGIYGQAGAGVAPIQKEDKPGYFDTAYFSFFQVGFLYDSTILNPKNRGQQVSLGYEYKRRRFKGGTRNKSGSSISYAYVFKIKHWSMGYLWIGPAARLIFYEDNYDFFSNADTEAITFGYGPIFGMNQRYSKRWTVRYSIEASNLDAYFTDSSSSDQERVLSLQFSIALLNTF